MKHYNNDEIACMPFSIPGSEEPDYEVCKNCARNILNKPDGNYVIRVFSRSGRGETSVTENGEHQVNIWRDCHEVNDYFMFDIFDDEDENRPVIQPSEESTVESKNTEEIMENSEETREITVDDPNQTPFATSNEPSLENAEESSVEE